MSSKFQDIVEKALSAKYIRSKWFDEEPHLRFATAVVSRNEKLDRTLQQYGQYYAFGYNVSTILPSTESGRGESDEETNEDKVKGMYLNEVPLRAIEAPLILEELSLNQQILEEYNNPKILTWIKELYESSRGFEIGTFDSSLVAITMQKQAANWEPIALGYIRDIICMAHNFITSLLKRVCPETHVREGIMTVLMEDLIQKYKKAVDHVHFLLHVERDDTLITLNKGFYGALNERLVLSCHSIFILTLLDDNNV